MRRPSFSVTVRRSTTLRCGLERLIDLERKGERVPALWLTPADATPAPAALLLHGLSSQKERMSNAIGRALLERGVASLALDLPMHGERRDGNGKNVFGNPLALVGAWRTAVREVEDAVTWLSSQDAVNPARLGVVGYSLGGFLALMAAADDPRMRVITLAAAGDLPDTTPYAALVRGVVDPPRAAKRLDGRPLLMVNGRHDTTTRPAQAQRLFVAAVEPKTLLWYPGAHWPPDAAIEKAAEWTATKLRALEDTVGGHSKRAG